MAFSFALESFTFRICERVGTKFPGLLGIRANPVKAAKDAV